MKEDPEKQLIKRAKNGDRTAFDLLVRSCAKKVYNNVLRLCGSPQMAEDILQDGFVKAYKNIKGFKEESAFASWVSRIAINCWKNRVRYEKRRKFFSHFSLGAGKEDEDEREIQVASEAPGPDRDLERKLKKEKVQNALNSINDQAREMIVLRDIEELSYEEIANMLGISMGTVKSRIARARSRLKEKLKKDFGDD